MIHPTAIIEPGAKLHPSVKVGPYSIIGPEVTVGEGSVIGPHVVINGQTTIGRDNQFFQFSSIGEVPQAKTSEVEAGTSLLIGDHNIFRECVTVHRGTVRGGGVTKIGSDNLFMANCHVAHDCQLGNHNIMVNSSAVAGHVEMGDYVIISGMCGVHQFCHIGSHAFISHATMIGKDVPPYVIVIGGSDATVCGINVTGLKRRGFSAPAIQALQKAYKVIYREGLRAEEAIKVLAEMQKEHPEVQLFTDFLRASERGIIR